VPPNAEHRATILKATDVAEMVIAVAKLPARAHVPELTIKPTSQLFV
jgi:NADP-dependent 3-hydroxy acid dehydrogenase YdfG